MPIQMPSFGQVQPNFNRTKEQAEQGDALAGYLQKGILASKELAAKQAMQQAEMGHETTMQQLKGQQAMDLDTAKRQGTESQLRRMLGVSDEAPLSDAVDRATAKGQSIAMSESGPHIGQDPTRNMMRTQMQGEKDAYKTGIGVYNKAIGGMDKQISASDKLIHAMANPDNPSTVGVARSLMLNIHGMNRFNEPEAKAMVQDTVTRKLAGLGISAGMDASQMITPEQQKGVMDIVNEQLGALGRENQMFQQQAKSTYQGHPFATQQGVQAFDNIHAPMANRIQDLQNGPVKQFYDNYQKKSQARQQQEQSGLGGWLKGTWGRLTGTGTSNFTPSTAGSGGMPAGAVRKQVSPSTGAVRYLDANGNVVQ